MVVTRTNLIVGINKGHAVTPLEKVVKPVQLKGKSSARTTVVRSVVREVVGFAPYEKRVMELLRNSKDKKARKLTKNRLGTLKRAKRKVEELSDVIQHQRKTAA